MEQSTGNRIRGYRKIIGKVTDILLIALIMAIILSFVAGIRPYIVLSGSMEPMIPTGSLIWINTRDTAVKEGDIAAYRTGDILVTHRIVGITEDGRYITKGDNNETADASPVPSENIAGTYVMHVPAMGYAISAVRSILPIDRIRLK
ncbi:MAG: signal peptidase I [Lachnospiraceae bacterium]|nr:signal peptidase I [Lachnospiraceae bacterium]